MHFYGFFQTEYRLSKNLITLTTFSANKCPLFLRAQNSKFQNQCSLQEKKLVPPSFEAKFNFSRGLNFANVNFREISSEIIFAEKVEIQSTPLNLATQGM